MENGWPGERSGGGEALRPRDGQGAAQDRFPRRFASNISAADIALADGGGAPPPSAVAGRAGVCGRCTAAVRGAAAAIGGGRPKGATAGRVSGGTRSARASRREVSNTCGVASVSAVRAAARRRARRSARASRDARHRAGRLDGVAPAV
ncbi:MAG: hypothetical protein JW751_32015 [Polyangiaceae bacterium]|nr:hypothetical protein [Polyangiaceae bacterium]